MKTKSKASARERSLILHDQEVRAALSGQLTQVWRPIFRDDSQHHMPWRVSGTHWQDGDSVLTCPFGEPWTRLWCRETYIVGYDTDEDGGLIMEDEDGNELPEKVFYAATEDPELRWLGDDGYLDADVPWKSAATMPRHCSRLTLETVAVRVARVQEIMGYEAKAAGADCRTDLSWEGTTEAADFAGKGYRAGFKADWDARYATKGMGFEAKPWAWAVTVRTVEGQTT